MASSSSQKRPLITFYVELSLCEAIMSKTSISSFAFNFFYQQLSRQSQAKPLHLRTLIFIKVHTDFKFCLILHPFDRSKTPTFMLLKEKKILRLGIFFFSDKIRDFRNLESNLSTFAGCKIFYKLIIRKSQVWQQLSTSSLQLQLEALGYCEEGIFFMFFKNRGYGNIYIYINKYLNLSCLGTVSGCITNSAVSYSFLKLFS